MKKLSTVFLVFLGYGAMAQTQVYLDFQPKMGGQDLVLGNVYQDLNGISMSVDNFNYYISNVHIIHDGGQDLDLDTVMLVRAEDHELNLGLLNVTNIEAVNFGVGVPQDLNHNDISLLPENHPLSWQTPSMHWGWTSGYKFMLCDAWGDGNGDGTPESVFQLHCLGDANYKYENLNVVPTVFPWGGVSVVINCNLDEWIFGSNPGTTGVQHGSTGINASVMNNVTVRNVFEVPATADLENIVGSEGVITLASSPSGVTLNWSNVGGASTYRLIDVSGKLICEGQVVSSTGSISVPNIDSGSYIFYIQSGDNSVLNRMKFVR